MLKLKTGLTVEVNGYELLPHEDSGYELVAYVEAGNSLSPGIPGIW